MEDRSLPQLDDLYKEIILEHYRNPYGRIPVKKVDYKAEGMNPLCGDEIYLCLQVKDKKIDKVYVNARGCSISVASGSILAQTLEGKTIDEAKNISCYFKNIMHNRTEVRGQSSEVRNGKSIIDIGDLETLEGVKKFPVRIKCALLPWTTLEEALVGHEHVEIS